MFSAQSTRGTARLSRDFARVLRILCLSSLVPAALLVAATTVVTAQETPGRFAMKDIEGGILRMDTKTGRISQCKKKDGEWACESIADDSAGLEDRISELKRENNALRAMLADAEKALLAAEGKAREKAKELPNDEELDRVMAFIEKFMRRFFDFAKSMRETLGKEV